tara:strand:- start:6818 stop:7042 length:225 start_codon:yes stop_codon:yes gene_type:complete
LFSDQHLQTLRELLERRQDPVVTTETYDDMLRMVATEQAIRKSTRQKQKEVQARKSAVLAPHIPTDPFNDPSGW